LEARGPVCQPLKADVAVKLQVPRDQELDMLSLFGFVSCQLFYWFAYFPTVTNNKQQQSMSTNLPDSIQKFISETIPDTQHIPVIYEWLEYVWTDRRQGSLMVFETWDATFVNNLVTIAHYGL
jgi:hypothetical protein